MAFNTQLLMQMLAGGSQSLLQGQPMMSGINPVTEQSIANQSYAGLMQKILGGGGKLNMDKDKFAISGPLTSIGDQGANPVASGDPTSAGYGGTPQGQADRSGPNSQGMPKGNVMAPNNVNMLMQMLMGGAGSGSSNPQQAL